MSAKESLLLKKVARLAIRCKDEEVASLAPPFNSSPFWERGRGHCHQVKDPSRSSVPPPVKGGGGFGKTLDLIAVEVRRGMGRYSPLFAPLPEKEISFHH
jgi:hypothetical protein